MSPSSPPNASPTPSGGSVPFDRHLWEMELREVCTRHGLTVQPGEQVYGWVAVVGITGHDAQGFEYRRPVCLTSIGLTHIEVMHLISAKLKMLMKRARRHQVVT